MPKPTPAEVKYDLNNLLDEVSGEMSEAIKLLDKFIKVCPGEFNAVKEKVQSIRKMQAALSDKLGVVQL